MGKNLFSFLFLSISFCFFAQNSNLIITLTGTPETCLNNGSLTWSTSGETAGATLVYSVYNNAVTTVNTITSSSTLSGLPAGSYRVVVTETSGNQSSQATSNNFVILNQKPELAFSSTLVNNEICGNDGSFKVNVSSGRAPYVYQLLNSVDNSVLLEQPSNTFTNLKAGNYKYRVIDACGSGLVSQQEIKYTPSKKPSQGLGLVVTPLACTSLKLSFKYLSMEVLKYPLTISATFMKPGVAEPQTVVVTNIQKYEESLDIPFFDTVTSLSVRIVVKDACLNSSPYTFDETIYQQLHHRVTKPSSTCNGQYLQFGLGERTSSIPNPIQSPFKITFLTVPAGFNPSQSNTNHNNFAFEQIYGSSTNPLPVGTYTYEVSDACGRKVQSSAEVTTYPFTIQSSNNLPECSGDFSSIMLQPNSGNYFASVRITSAPASFGPLPFDVPESWYDTVSNNQKLRLLLTHLPSGNYTVEAVAGCGGDVATFSFITSQRVIETPAIVTVQQSCGGIIRISADKGTNFKYQRYYSSVGGWGNLENLAVTDGSGKQYNANTIQTGSNFTLLPGRYRIIADKLNFYNVRTSTGKAETFYCDPIVLKEFVVGNTVVFNDAYAFQCANGTYDVSLIASGGIAPLQYAIVSAQENGTILRDNGTNPIFEGLQSGIYFFRVIDNCGNFVTRKMDIALLGKPGIRTTANCMTNELILSIDNLNHLNFQWFRNDNPSTILSTANVLDLGQFTLGKAGEYSVRITSNSATSCISSIFKISLRPDALTNAEAGTGQVVNINYDGTQTKLNLFDYLTGTFDTYGTWTETTTLPSNLLVKNEWLVRSAQAGTYTFKYTVTPLCGGVEKSSFVTINLAKVCYKLPVVDGGTIEETKFGITLLGRAGAKSDNWPMVRKGGWMALESNTKGFVINRVSFNTNNLPVGIPIANFVEGMMVYDTTNECMKIYNGTVWSCFSTQTCPE